MKKTNAVIARLALAMITVYPGFISAANSILSSGNWYKLSAHETGIYVITYNDLVSLGISPASIDPRNISMYGNGPGELPLLNSAARPHDLQEIAIEVRGESDGTFDPGDTIFFYNHSQTIWKISQNSSWRFQHFINHYSDSTGFFLTIGSTPGKRIIDRQSDVSYTDSTSSYTAYDVHESDQINFLRSGQEWFGEHFDMLSNQVKKFPVKLKNFSDGDSTIINFSLAVRDLGTTQGSMTFTFDGFSYVHLLPNIGSSPQDNFAALVYKQTFFGAPFINDSIELTFQSANPSAECWLNFIEVNSICDLIFDNSPMNFRDSRKTGPGEILKYQIAAQSGIKIWDVTDFNNVTNQLYSINGSMIEFNFRSDSLREFIAFDGSNFLIPVFSGAIANQNLHSIENKNLIILTDETFEVSAMILAQHHLSNDNLSYAIVTPQQIYNEYSSGVQDVVAIRDFFRQVYHSVGAPTDSLKYVIMFGSPSYDYKNTLGLGNNFVPIYESPGSLNLTQTYSTDDFFALLDSSEGQFSTSEIIDVAIGRIPVRSVAEAQIVNKIILYNTNSSTGLWKTKSTFISDDQDYNIHFRQTDTLAERIATYDCGLNVDKIYIDAFTQVHDTINNTDSYPDAQAKIESAFRQGSAVIQYSGHTDSACWASERILEYNFLDTLNNLMNLPLILTNGSNFSKVDDALDNSGGRRALINPNGGSIGSFSSSGLQFSSSANNLTTILNRNLYTQNAGRWKTLGEMFLQTKQVTYPDPYLRSYNLLGDPATRIIFPENRVVVNSFSPDTLTPYNPVQISGEIHDASGTLMNSFNGDLDVTFFKPQTLHMTLGNDSLNTSNPGVPQPFYVWDDTLYHTMVNVLNGIWSLNFMAPTNIDSGIVSGKISLFASTSTETAMGCIQNIFYQNLTPGISENPEIQLNIFPNPAREQIRCVLMSKNFNDWSYSLTGIDGRELRKEKISSSEFTIERKSIASGIYFLNVLDREGVSLKLCKIVFQ